MGAFAIASGKQGNRRWWRRAGVPGKPFGVRVLHCGSQHGPAVRRARPRRGAVPRSGREQQGDARRAKRLTGGQRGMQVADVNGIERAAENCPHAALASQAGARPVDATGGKRDAFVKIAAT